MLGRTLACVLKNDFEVIALNSHDGDVTNLDLLNRTICFYKPDVMINCAAMTSVDDCEIRPDLAFKVNSDGCANLAIVCSNNNIRLISISTDYVFDGTKGSPYNESDTPDGGLSVYGKSKFLGEENIRRICKNHTILRTAWLYGDGGPSFLHKILRMAMDPEISEIKAVNDQSGNPTSTMVVADVIRNILHRSEICGTFHISCEGTASRFEFASEIFRLLNVNKKIISCSTNEFPTLAKRPMDTSLDKILLKRFGFIFPHWKESLFKFLTDSEGKRGGKTS